MGKIEYTRSRSQKQPSVQRPLQGKSDLKDSKDLEGDLIKLLNDYWNNSSFGYPIHADVRIPTSVAETLHTESHKKLNDVECDEFGEGVNMREMLRMSAIMNNKPEFLNEYERLLRQWERSQKEALSRPSKVDPLAEFERLFKLWQTTQNKIRQQTYW